MALSVTYTYLRDVQPQPYHSQQSSETQVHLALKHTDKSIGFISPTQSLAFILSLYSGKVHFCKLNTDLP